MTGKIDVQGKEITIISRDERIYFAYGYGKDFEKRSCAD